LAELAEGFPIKLIVVTDDGRRRAYYLRPRRGAVYSTIAGPIRGGSILEAGLGGAIHAQRGTAYVVEPTWIERLENFGRRMTQVIYPKDSSYIAIRLGLRPGSILLEAGLGSGFMTSVAAAIVCPTGLIIVYEVREDLIESAHKNLELAGFSGCVEIRRGDVRGARDLPSLDAVMLDLPDPWNALPAISRYLKPGKPAAVFLPTISQVDKLLASLPEGWIVESVEEILLREWEVKPGALRPSPRMIGHTGFIVLVRRLSGNPGKKRGESLVLSTCCEGNAG
jgi:tRNA (adenine57-N1/adenine58-N1)-methyltransferase